MRIPGIQRVVGRRNVDPSELREVRARLRRTRGKLAQRREEVKGLKAELRATRASVRDPFPDVALPGGVGAIVASVREERLSYLSVANLSMLARVVRELEEAGRPGLVIEAGTALGGSAIVMAAAKNPDRGMKVYDVFGTIPPPSEKDGEDVHRRYEKILSGDAQGVGKETYYGYRDDLRTEVAESFARHGVPTDVHRVDLVKGLFEDTLLIDEPVALAHLDGDWYESTMTCLTRIEPHLVTGGRFVLDDYYAWSGCRTAVDEFFAGRTDFRLERRAKLHAVKL